MRDVSLSTMPAFEMRCGSKDLAASGMTVPGGIHKEILGLLEEKD